MNSIDFMPHGHCYFWDPFILWSHAISDGIIALAYFIIPFSLFSIIKKRRDFSYIWLLSLFAIFILGCGATHILDVINIWSPLYEFDSLLRIVTALASVGTAIMLIKITPQIILIPTTSKWKAMNEELKSLNDTLERKVEERTAMLAQSAAQFQFMADSIPQMIWTAKNSGAVDYYNEGWYAYTGLSFAESIKGGWRGIIHPDDLFKMEHSWQHSIQTGQPFQIEFRIKSAVDHVYRWHLSRALPMKDDDGGIVKWFGSATNIHDQKVKYEELERVNEELDNFVYTASHDLKTPIANLEGLQLLINKKSEGILPDDLLSLFDLMNQQTQNLRTTIHDLSDVARIQREHTDDIEEVNIEDIVEEFKINHQETIQATHARLSSSLKTQNFSFSTRLMRSVIHNLLENALKYRSPNRNPVIDVQSYQESGFLILKIKDNGLGIKKRDQSKIFEMFKRFNREQEGTGVGLYIVKRIVEKYGGTIEVESQEKKGSVFTVYLKAMSKDESLAIDSSRHRR